MHEYLVQILLLFSTFLGVQKTPDSNSTWIVNKEWLKSEYTWTFSAQTEKISEICKDQNQYLIFPQIIHGVHRVWADDKLIFQSGDTSFQQASSFYERPSLSCKFLDDSKKLTWEVVTYSQYFARLDHFPSVENSEKKYYFLDVIINIVATGGLLILSLFSLFIFTGRVPKKYIISLFIGSLSFAGYAAFVTSNVFGMKMSMFTAHKIADVCIWIGSFCYIYFFRSYKHLGKIEFYAFIGSFIIAESLIIFGSDADIVQLGTTLPIPFSFFCLISFLVYAINDGIQFGFNKFKILGITSSVLFVLFGINDLLHITGIIDSFMVMPLGSIAGIFFLAAAANQNIELTYKQRDDLVSNLQAKIDEKTKDLTGAMDQLKKSQADLVQSARLASLGTLSAGIAHEINNSINFINGAVIPLERKVLKSIPEEDKVSVMKLFEAIKQGTKLTVEIVRSLRNFTGLNQAKVRDASIKEIVNSVLTILKSKLSGIQVIVDIDESLTLTCYQVGVNQIFMNILSNAIDVTPENGVIKISAIDKVDELEIKISDTGKGMTSETKARIFDPFFTTKDVGKGTGLGLHIVFKEVEKHNGRISVSSEINKGTEFTINLPKQQTIAEAA